jgi:GAF domain-containing protein
LEESQWYLQHHIAKLDALVATLQDLYRLGTKGTGPTSHEGLCQEIVKSACRLLKAAKGSLLLMDSEGYSLRLAASHGWENETGAPVCLGEGIAGRVAQTGKPIYVDDIHSDKRFLRPPLPSLESQVMASLPLRAVGRVIGVLTVNGEGSRPFEEREIRQLGILADQAALTLENFELCENLRRLNLDMAQALAQSSSQSLPLDRQAGHLRYFARGVVKELNLPEQMAQHVEYALMMCDIDRMGVSLAPEAEDGLAKRRNLMTRIFSQGAFLAPVAPMVLYHQEWYNGQGSSQGLSGEEIPLGARIVAVIGVWESLTSHRPLRQALPKEKAVQELAAGAGTRLDPVVVEAFLRFLKKEEKNQVPISAN